MTCSSPAGWSRYLVALVRHLFGLLFYQPRVHDDGRVAQPRGLNRCLVGLNQALIERGRTPPWVMSARECRQYWSQQAEGSDNAPSTYARNPTNVVDYLNDFWTPEVAPTFRILELGCNAGSALNRLQERGYRQLSALEINPHAIEALRTRFPELADAATIHLGSAEEILPSLASNSVDVIFSIATLMMVHPSSHTVFADMVRVASRYICVIETETANYSYIFARNYGRVFARLGAREVRSILLTEMSAPTVSRNYDGYTARLFALS